MSHIICKKDLKSTRRGLFLDPRIPGMPAGITNSPPGVNVSPELKNAPSPPFGVDTLSKLIPQTSPP